MSKPVLLSLGAGKVQELVGTANNDVLTWDSTLDGGSWKSAAGGGGGSGTVTSVGLTGGTSGIIIGGTASPITTSGTFNLDAPQRFAFDTTSPIAPTSPGQISWNTAEGSLNTLMAGGNVDAIVGQQLYQRAVNADTVTLTKGMVVYVDGSSGTRASVKRATADADLSSATILGVVAESIAQNAEGFIITNGLLKDLTVLPSTTFADGDVVYLSPTTAGGLTPTKPTAPDHLVMVGYCVKASNGAAGVLLVHPQNGYELGELHDVYINNPQSGQLLIYDATAGQTRWENASLTAGTNVTITNGAGSVTIAASSPYDISGEFVGTPASGATIMRFVAARAFTFGGTAYFACVTGPTSQATFTVNVNGVSKGTVNIATSATSGTGTITSTNIAAGDLITVVATTVANVVSPYWTLPGTV